MKERFRCAGGVVMFCFLISALFLAGCDSGGTEVGNPTGTLSSRFADDADLENYIKNELAASVVDMTWNDEVTTGNPPAANDGSGGDAESVNHSDTNVQEAGVDESDKVKSDGSYLYVAQDGGVRIVRLEADGAMSDVAQVPVGGPVDSLYLYQSLLVALYHPAGAEGSAWCGPAAAGLILPGSMPCWIPTSARTGVLMVDVQDPANPVQLSDRVFDGSLVSSRRIGGKLHLVSRFMPDIPALETSYYGSDSKEAVISRNREALKDLSLDQLLPVLQSRDQQGNVIHSGRLVATEDFLRPTLPQGGSIVTVSTFDLDRPQDTAVQALGAVLDAHEVYASTAAMYLAAETWSTDGRVKSLLHKFDLGGEKVAYVASGIVPGSILNQFSMGEYEGVLRVATSGWTDYPAHKASQVYCLRQGETGLEIVGRLENLAPGERLYAARFIGKRGFLVTFVQVDPLFTLDLADPAAPKVVGELKVEGYSDYIHPLEENLLLTIGKGAVQYNGGVFYQGVQLSIFDISNFADPKLRFREEIGDRGTSSEALYNHKAFTWWAANGLLAIPVDLYQYQAPPQSPADLGQHTFSGLYVYRVDAESGFTLLGRIATPNATVEYWYSPWTRGLFAADSVYAVTESSVSSAELTDIQNTVKTLDIGP